MTDLSPLAIADLDANLADDMDAPTAEFTVWAAPCEDAQVDNQGYHIIHHAGAQRGGIVFVGSGSSGLTCWTDAATPEEVLRRYLDDEMIG